MPYKQKTCPICSKVHNKRGLYCSRSCGNTRPMPEHQKEAIAAAKKEWHATSDIAAVASYNYTSKGSNKPPEPIAPTRPTYLEHNQFVSDGDLWEIAK